MNAGIASIQLPRFVARAGWRIWGICAAKHKTCKGKMEESGPLCRALSMLGASGFWRLSIRGLLRFLVLLGVLTLLSPGEIGEACFSILVLMAFVDLLPLRRVAILLSFDNSVDSPLCAPPLQALDLALQSLEFPPRVLLRCLELVYSPAEQVVDYFQLVDTRTQQVVLRNHSIEALRCLKVMYSRRSEGVCWQGDSIEEVLRSDIRVLVLRRGVATAERGAGRSVPVVALC